MEYFVLLDYSILKIIWWALLGFLLVAFAVMDGAVMGVALTMFFIARTDSERIALYNVVGPVWEGSQVWLIVTGGVLFAAWPLLYAVSFSAFYLVIMLLLAALIVRPVAIKYRNQRRNKSWRNGWDYLWALTGLVASMVFGVAVGNIIVGVPFSFEPIALRPMYEGEFFTFFTPFTLFCGVLSVLMAAAHGAAWLTWKVDNPIAERAARIGCIMALLSAVVFVLGGFWVTYGINGYSIISHIQPKLALSPLEKIVITAPGALMHNFEQWPLLWIAPLMGTSGALLAFTLFLGRGSLLTSVATTISISGIVLTFGFALFPFLLPSSTSPNSSLTVWDASASHFSLWLMLMCTIVLLPIVVTYTLWVYNIMRGKVQIHRSDNNTGY